MSAVSRRGPSTAAPPTQHAPVGRREQPGREQQQRRLAAAARADDGDRLARRRPSSESASRARTERSEPSYVMRDAVEAERRHGRARYFAAVRRGLVVRDVGLEVALVLHPREHRVDVGLASAADAVGIRVDLVGRRERLGQLRLLDEQLRGSASGFLLMSLTAMSHAVSTPSSVGAAARLGEVLVGEDQHRLRQVRRRLRVVADDLGAALLGEREERLGQRGGLELAAP